MKNIVIILGMLFCLFSMTASNCASTNPITNTGNTPNSSVSTGTGTSASAGGTGTSTTSETTTVVPIGGGSSTSTTTSIGELGSLPCISPYHKTTMVSLTPMLRWASMEDGTVYSVYCNQSSYPSTIIAANLHVPFFKIMRPLGQSKTYYWKVIAKNKKGETKESPVFQFTTLQYGSNAFITKYTVLNGDLLFETDMIGLSNENLFLQRNKLRHQELWTHVKNLIPMSLISYVKEFYVFNTDGSPVGIVKKLTPNHTNKEMSLGLDIKTAYDASGNYLGNGFSSTIIHEFGHLASYTETEIDETIAQEGCQTYYSSQGAARPTSILWIIYNKYWLTIPRADLLDLTPEQRQVRYLPPNDASFPFASVYAMKSIEEDVAETFRAFVVEKKPTPSANPYFKYYNKILEYYAIPKFVEYRNAIRATDEFRRLFP